MKFLKNITVLFLITFPIISFAQDNYPDEMKFLDLYYTNKDGERISTYKRSTKTVFLVVETKNGKGEDVTVEMEENDPEVIYKRRYINTGDTFNYTLKKDVERIKLTIFDRHKKRHQRIKKRTIRKANSTKPEDTEIETIKEIQEPED